MTNRNSVINYTTKNIREFKAGVDTVYMRRLYGNGYQVTYYCTFVSYNRGIVTGKIISAEPEHTWSENSELKEVRTRITSCYLWGNDKSTLNYDHCIWFKGDGYAK